MLNGLFSLLSLTHLYKPNAECRETKGKTMTVWRLTTAYLACLLLLSLTVESFELEVVSEFDFRVEGSLKYLNFLSDDLFTWGLEWFHKVGGDDETWELLDAPNLPFAGATPLPYSTGASIAITGEVGHPNGSCIIHYNTTNGWMIGKSLIGGAGEELGSAVVVIDENTVATGSSGNPSNIDIYTRNLGGENNWGLSQRISDVDVNGVWSLSLTNGYIVACVERRFQSFDYWCYILEQVEGVWTSLPHQYRWTGVDRWYDNGSFVSRSSGGVVVYYEGSQIQNVVSPDGGSQFGTALAVSGDFMVVGAPDENAVYLYSRKALDERWKLEERKAGTLGATIGSAIASHNGRFLIDDGTTLRLFRVGGCGDGALSGDEECDPPDETACCSEECLVIDDCGGLFSGIDIQLLIWISSVLGVLLLVLVIGVFGYSLVVKSRETAVMTALLAAEGNKGRRVPEPQRPFSRSASKAPSRRLSGSDGRGRLASVSRR